MKCYFCKKEITRSHRTYVPNRNHREKSKYRDLCTDCYIGFREAEGFAWNEKKRMWEKKSGYNIQVDTGINSNEYNPHSQQRTPLAECLMAEGKR